MVDGISPADRLDDPVVGAVRPAGRHEHRRLSQVTPLLNIVPASVVDAARPGFGRERGEFRRVVFELVLLAVWACKNDALLSARWLLRPATARNVLSDLLELDQASLRLRRVAQVVGRRRKAQRFSRFGSIEISPKAYLGRHWGEAFDKLFLRLSGREVPKIWALVRLRRCRSQTNRCKTADCHKKHFSHVELPSPSIREWPHCTFPPSLYDRRPHEPILFTSWVADG